MKIIPSLVDLGMPMKFRHKHPDDLTDEELAKAFPDKLNAEALHLWVKTRGKPAANVKTAWFNKLGAFIDACNKRKINPYSGDISTRSGQNGQVEAFIKQQRWRVRNFIEQNLAELFKHNIRQSSVEWKLEGRSSMLIVSELELRLPVGTNPLHLIREYAKQPRFWVQPAAHPSGKKALLNIKHRAYPGFVEVGLSAGLGQNLYLWYTLRCPLLPVSADYKNPNSVDQVMLAMWKEITQSYRWFSTNDPRARYF